MAATSCPVGGYPFASRLATHPCSFDSRLAGPNESPSHWFDSANGLRLKDTGKSARYRNVPIDTVRFRYSLPLGQKREKVALLSDHMTSFRPISYYMCKHGFDHYIGEYVVTSYVDTRREAYCVLHRVLDQPDPPSEPDMKRSRSERRHETVLRELFPAPTFRVTHEPESAVGFRGQLIVGGEVQVWASDVYIPDFLISYDAPPHGIVRIAVESKYDADGVDEVAVAKCRRLRVAQAVNVLLVYGHGDAMRFVTFGEDDGETIVRTRDEYSDVVSSIRDALRNSL